MIGVSGRMFLGDGLLLNDGNQETIYINMVAKIFPVFIAGIFLSAILAAIMSTADSQLLVTASAITEDFYHNKIRKNASEKELMWVSRGCVMAVAIIAVLIATNQNSTILGLVSYAWGGFGSAFGPLVLCSLFWRRTNKQGAYAGIIVGGVVDLVWAQLSGGIFDLYEIVPGFVFGLLAIVVVTVPVNMEPQLDNADMIIISRRAKIPTVIISVLFFVAISCNFFAIPVATLAVFVNVSFAVLASAPARLALAYSRLMRCFCSCLCNCFFGLLPFRCGFSLMNFSYSSFISAVTCFFCNRSRRSRFLCALLLR